MTESNSVPLPAPSTDPSKATSGGDGCGPISYPGVTAQVVPGGVQGTATAFSAPCARTAPWQWIWLSAEVKTAAILRKEVVLTDTPRQVTAWVTADRKYRLYVNGRLVSRGPVDIGRDYHGGSTERWFYDCRDLTPYFKAGVNCIAAEVFREWPIGWAVTTGNNGFLFEADLVMGDSLRQRIGSDESWKATPARYLQGDGRVIDANLEPRGWRLAGFDDRDWERCIAVENRWPALVASEIPPLMEVRYPVLRMDHATGGVELPQQAGEAIRVTADGSFRVVFDRVLSAFPVIRVKGGKGAVIRIQCHRDSSFVLDGGERTFESPYMDEIVPAMTVEVSNVTEPLEITEASAVFTSQPVPYRGSFACSDEQLNRIWEVSRWANQICLQTHHLDSPNHQEPISDPGDYIIEAMVTYYAHGEPWLARQDIRKFAWLLRNEKYHNFHTSYSLYWLQMLMDYYQYTADRALVEEMAQYVHELLDTYTSWRGANGLISEAPNYMFMDWVEIGGFGCHHPPAVIGQGYLTALYCHGLAQGMQVAEMMGDSQRVAKYSALREATARAFERELWNPQQGLYRDGRPFQTSVRPHEWLPEDKNIETFSPHVNLLAVLYDLAPADRQRSITEKIMLDDKPNTQPWFMHWVFQALEHAGLFETHGLRQMRRWEVLDETQSFREMWKDGDLSHGWCSTPLVQMSAVVLGVTPASPGWEQITIRPGPCDLQWARGVVPTPGGDVAVAWRRVATAMEIDVTVPTQSTAILHLPHLGLERPVVRVNGVVTERVPLLLPPGQHHVVLTSGSP